MGVKLERLLSRPSSLQLLRYLVGSPAAPRQHTVAERNRHATAGSRSRRRVYSAVAGIQVNEEIRHHGVEASKTTNDTTIMSTPTTSLGSHALLNEPHSIAPASTQKTFERWDGLHWTHEKLDYESDIKTPSLPGKPKLLDGEHKDDIQLWAYLFDYRERIYGLEATSTFFNAIVERDILIPTTGFIADRFWLAFLRWGFQDFACLLQVCDYADHIWNTEQRSWPKLYHFVIRHFLLTGNREDVEVWHSLLFPNHSPGRRQFSELMRYVIIRDVDQSPLRYLYAENNHRNLYAKIIPLLCEQQDAESATKWHFLFVKHGDLPPDVKTVEPLIQYHEKHRSKKSARIIQTLISAGVTTQKDKKIYDDGMSIPEAINLMHGETLNVQAKKYNDELGARWFATRWMPLDTAINVVHAFGVETIGPLSLQAIALRDSTPESVTQRILQLEELGISIGKSVFARAVSHFAKRAYTEDLQGLLTSDQHPDALDDRQLQARLLQLYSSKKDWPQYRRTLRVLSLDKAVFSRAADHFAQCGYDEDLQALLNVDNPDWFQDRKLQTKLLQVFTENEDWTQYRKTWEALSMDDRLPVVERWNYNLIQQLDFGDLMGVKRTLEDMRQLRLPLTESTISASIEKVLLPRRKGHNPRLIPGSSNRAENNDLNMTFALVRYAMDSGNHVPVVKWREILRRMGMLGRWADLENLSMFLVDNYSSSPSMPHVHAAHVVPSGKQSLLELFNATFQKSIVEWGFIHSLQQERMDFWQRSLPHGVPKSRLQHLPVNDAIQKSPLPDLTKGLTLLKSLSRRGVYIDTWAIKSALMNRLVTYFGPGTSDDPSARISQVRLRGQLHRVAAQIDERLGEKWLAESKIADIIAEVGQRRQAKKQRLLEKRAIWADHWRRDGKTSWHRGAD